MPGNILLLSLAAGALILGMLLWLKFRPKKTHAGGEFVYEMWRAILTPSEQLFVRELEKSLPSEVRLLAKVRLSDVFFTRKDLDAVQRTKARNRINQKHVDFLLVRTSDFAPLLGIEFDKSSGADDRKQRDRFVDEVFAGCDVPLFHIPAATSYELIDLHRTLTVRQIAHR